MRLSATTLLLALALAGCSNTRASVKTDAFDPRPDRIFLWSGLEHAKSGVRFDPAFVQAFHRRLAEDLTACGAAVTVFSDSGLEADARAFVEAADASQASTVITLRKTHGQLDAAGRLLWATYDVESKGTAVPGTPALLAAARGQKPIPHYNGEVILSIVYPWTGFKGTPFDVQGAYQADRVTNKLKADGFFPGCAPVELPQSPSASGW